MKKIVVVTIGKWVKLLLLAVLLIGGIFCGQAYFPDQQAAVSVSTGGQDTVAEEQEWVKWLKQSLSEQNMQQVLQIGWSILGSEAADGQAISKSLLDRSMQQLIGFDLTNPYQQLGEGMAVLATEDFSRAVSSQPVAFAEKDEDYYLNTEAQADDWHFEMSKLSDLSLSDEVMILLYHTHNAETYNPTDGVSKRPGENAGVSIAADLLQNSLEKKYGLKTLHSKVLHDYPDWSRSYINSLATVKDLLAGNPQVQAVFDVHRDAGFTSKDPTTMVINGQKAAKIMIVVGANHESWKTNLAFAQALEDKSNALYPGLVRSIRIVQSSRYNQQAHPQSLILEVGSDLNTQEEANYSMECFAQVIAEVMLPKSADT